MKKLEMLRPERKADSTTIDVATFGQSSTRGQPIHQAPLYTPTNNGAPECEKMANATERSKTTLTSSGIGSGAQPARHSKDGICRAFRPVGVKLEHGALDDFAHHSIRFGNIPEIGSWQKRFLDSQSTKHAPKVTIVGMPLATPNARTTAAKNATGRIPSKASMPTSPQPPRRKPECLKRLLEKEDLTAEVLLWDRTEPCATFFSRANQSETESGSPYIAEKPRTMISRSRLNVRSLNIFENSSRSSGNSSYEERASFAYPSAI